ncbi:CdiI immunity protein domain-containing protein [Citrobacter freundii]|uniref:hypothetical protein n=1 Tax=Citrobacter freundii TaxID=546 RepID=UPI003B25DB1F
MFAGKKSAQIREILINESAWEDMTCLFAPSLALNDGVVVDIGWYPSFEEGGEFIIQVIQNSDWDHPMIKISSGWDKNELIEKLNIVLEQLPFCLKS